jgi:hypothetical protein
LSAIAARPVIVERFDGDGFEAAAVRRGGAFATRLRVDGRSAARLRFKAFIRSMTFCGDGAGRVRWFECSQSAAVPEAAQSAAPRHAA